MPHFACLGNLPGTPDHTPCDTHQEGTWDEVNRACERHMRATGHCAWTGTTPP